MELFGADPGRSVITYFLTVIVAGTILLALPFASVDQSASIVDALFTATSAVCVTGLTVLDTGTDFTLFGQLVILLLIQLGGLGIMTFATTLLMAGARLSFQNRLGLAQTFGTSVWRRSKSLLTAIIVATLSFEFIGAVALFVRFKDQFPFGQAVFHSIFHSVSAFCNAGFSTFSNSLENYQSDIPMIAVFSVLIICGGLGFAVMGELVEYTATRKSSLSLHTKLCLTTTVVLLIVGTVALYTVEYDNSLAGSGTAHSVANAFFQSVTCRTAGFNTIAQKSLTEVGILVTMILMFIGACPGSTGGGIKTTTFAVILLLLYNRFRGRGSVSVFRRSISNDSIIKAVSVMLLAFLIIIALGALLMFAEEKPVPHLLSHGWFVDNVFEMVSAFSTVGLSLGITSRLSDLGKVVLILAMFIGRVGLLTLAFALARPRKPGEIVYAEEQVMVG